MDLSTGRCDAYRPVHRIEVEDEGMVAVQGVHPYGARTVVDGVVPGAVIQCSLQGRGLGCGTQCADLTDEQKELLLDLIANWSEMADDESNAATRAEIEATLDETVVAWSGETSYDMNSGDGINFSISGPNVYVAFEAQQGSAGADVDGVSTSGWGHVHTIYRDPSNDYANSVEQQESTGMSGGPSGDMGEMGEGELGEMGGDMAGSGAPAGGADADSE